MADETMTDEAMAELAARADSVLSKGCLEAIFTDLEQARLTYPVLTLQCLQVKTLQAQGGQAERFRIICSDGLFYTYGMLATQTVGIVHDNTLKRNSMIRINSYQANSVKGKNVVVILDIEVLQEFEGIGKVANPAPLENRINNLPQQLASIPGQNFYGAKPESTDSKIKVEPMSNAVTHRPGGTAAAAAVSHGGAQIYPIEAVSLYAHKWTIKARVTVKSDVRTWHKPTGEGKLFSINLLDESGEIKLTGFNEQVDQFYDVFQVGSVYYVSTPCKVAFAKKQFTNLAHDFELTLERDTVVEKAEDQDSVPQVRYNFHAIRDIGSVDKDATVDVLGVLHEVDELNEIKSKTTGKPYEKRDVTIVDETGYSIRLTVWGKTARAFDARPESIIAFKGVKVSDFNGRSLSLLASGTMSVEPDIDEAHRLRGWYDASGRSCAYVTHRDNAGSGALGAAAGRRDEVKTIAQVKDEALGTDKDDYFALKATVLYIKQDTFAYPACLTDKCNKKVIEATDGTWRCEKCEMNHDHPNYRYMMSIAVGDHTGQIWLSCFDDSARSIMGMSADELYSVIDDEPQRAAVFDAATCKSLSFRVRAKMDQYGENARIRYQTMSAGPVDFAAEGRRLAGLIEQYDINS